MRRVPRSGVFLKRNLEDRAVPDSVSLSENGAALSQIWSDIAIARGIMPDEQTPDPRLQGALRGLAGGGMVTLRCKQLLISQICGFVIEQVYSSHPFG